jgi:hypothetical protein
MKKPILNEEISRLRKIMGLNENFEMPSTSEFELNGRPVDVSGIDFYPLEQHVYTEYGLTGLYYEDNGEELTPEECKEFWVKYKNFVDDEYNEASEKAYYQNIGIDETEKMEEEMVSFDDLISQEDQAMIDAHDEEDANKYASKNYDDVESGAIDEDWGGSDQGYMNKSIHDSLNQPTEFSFGMYDDLKNAAEEAVDHFWDDWEEYKTDRDGLVMKAMRLYLRRYFPDWYENTSKMFS